MNSNESYYNYLLQNIFGPLMILTSLVVVIIGLVRKKYISRDIYFFWKYRLTVLIINFIIWLFVWSVNNYYYHFKPFLDAFKIENNYFLSILMYLCDILFLGIFYSKLFKSKVLRTLTFLHLFLAILIYIFIDGYHEYGTINALIINTLILFSSLLYIAFKFKEKLYKSILSNQYILISIGLFMPNLVRILFTIFANDLDKTNFVLYVKLKIASNFIDFFGYYLFGWVFLKSNSKNS